MTFECNIELDNTDLAISEMRQAVIRGLEKCGLTAEGYAKALCPVDTGNLRNSITHQTDDENLTEQIGTNSEYGPYVELGTGKYYPGGRRGWWVYVEGGSNPRPSGRPMRTYTYEEAKRIVAILRSKGLDAHMTEGQPARPYLKPAVADHAQQWEQILKNECENA